MKRLLAPLVAVATACATTNQSSSASIAPLPAIRSELTAEQRVEHALSRLTYGARPGDEERVRALGLERWMSLQLHPEAIADQRSDSALASYSTLTIATRELMDVFREVRAARRDSARPPAAMDSRRTLQRSLGELVSAKLTRGAVSERQLYEQMVDFWENHFSVFAGKGPTRLFIPSYDRDVIRPRAMGRFRDLLGAVARSPAMLFYLDNARSTSRGLNENYARELMELHTLGVDGGYTQQDVVEVARALTGWSIEPRTGEFVFRARAHDDGDKTVLGTRIADGGIGDGEHVLDLLARHPSTARFIVTKLAVRFVSDTAPPALVDRCAAVFSASDGDIRRTLECVVASPEFFSRAAYRAKVKTPLELVISALRATGSVPDATPRSTQILAQLGQPVFGRQTPDGWPDKAADWVNAGAMVNRTNFGLSLAAGRIAGIRPGPTTAGAGALLATPAFQRR